MEARDFIYHFTDILFSEMVKSTILTENWAEKDFDYRYVEYADIFIRMKESYLAPDRTDNEVFQMLNNSKKTSINLYNEIMKKNFSEELKRNNVNSAIFEQFLSSDLLKEDTVNIQSLEKFRQFEENLNPKTENEV